MKSLIVLVRVITSNYSKSIATVEYKSGKTRDYKFNEITELPKSVQNVIIGNCNTLVTDSYTTFFTGNATENDVDFALRWAIDCNAKVIYKGVAITERGALERFITRYENLRFRVDHDKKTVRVNRTKYSDRHYFEYVSPKSILTSAVFKYLNILDKRGFIEHI